VIYRSRGKSLNSVSNCESFVLTVCSLSAESHHSSSLAVSWLIEARSGHTVMVRGHCDDRDDGIHLKWIGATCIRVVVTVHG
jgi:hypothetical protein